MMERDESLTLGIDVSGRHRAPGLSSMATRWSLKASSRRTVPAHQGRGEEGGSRRRSATIGGVAVALPAASNAVPDDLADALRGYLQGRADTAIAAGTAAAIAEQWCGAARGVQAGHFILDRPST